MRCRASRASSDASNDPIDFYILTALPGHTSTSTGHLPTGREISDALSGAHGAPMLRLEMGAEAAGDVREVTVRDTRGVRSNEKAPT